MNLAADSENPGGAFWDALVALLDIGPVDVGHIRAYARPTPWMVDGKPGRILSCMVAAVKTAEGAINRGGDKGVAAQDVIDSARAALSEHGIALMVTSTPPHIEVGKGMPYASMLLHIRFIADDGSFIEHAVPAGGAARNNKHMQAAFTSGMKSALRHVLMLSVSDTAETQPRDKTERTSKALLAHIRYLNGVTDLDELRAAGQHATALALNAKDTDRARQHYQRRLDELNQIAGAQWAAKEQRDRVAARQAKRERDVQADVKSSRRSGPRKPPIDLSQTEPLT